MSARHDGCDRDARHDGCDRVARHWYSRDMIRLAVQVRLSVPGIGSRSVVKVLGIVKSVLGVLPGDRLPCANTVDSWTRKCGLDIYCGEAQRLPAKDVCLIIDESMMIGSNKLAVTLAAPAQHPGRPLGHGDVCVAGIDVAESFDSRKICDALTRAAGRIGAEPKYVITDNASVMKKGVGLSGYSHHLDVSHSLGMVLERCYKNEEDFTEYCKQMSNAKFCHNMKGVAYLLPPNQRTVARFLNIGSWVEWSKLVLDNMWHLSPAERQTLSFVPRHMSLIQELSEVTACVKQIERELKDNGLSRDTACTCKRMIRDSLLRCGNARMGKVAFALIRYIDSEAGLVGNETHNISSDILESSFGILKAMKSPNKLYGVTAMILHIPAYQRLCNLNDTKDYDLARHLVNTRCKDIERWKRENLPKNLVHKRNMTLSKKYAS